MGERPVKVAVLGAGSFVRGSYLPALARAPGALEPVALWSRSEASVNALLGQIAPGGVALHGEAGLQRLLHRRGLELDAAIVALPPQAAPAVVSALLSHGIHVLSEKPAAPTLPEAQALLAAAEAGEGESGALWCVAENWRSMAAFQHVCGALAGGGLGAIARLDMSVDLAMQPGNKYYGSEWRRDSEGLPGAYLTEGGVHFVAALRMAATAAGFGEAVKVSASARGLKEDLPTPDTLSGVVFFATGGCAATFSMTMAAAAMRVALTAVGTKGTIEVVRGGAGGGGSGSIDRGFRIVLQPATEGEPSTVESTSTGVDEELACFARLVAARLGGAEAGEAREEASTAGCSEGGVLGGDAYRVSSVEAARDLALVAALLESAAGGGAVTAVEPVGGGA